MTARDDFDTARQTSEAETTAETMCEGQRLPHDQWKRELDAFLNSLRPCNPDVDDSRESIYPVRG